MVRKKYDFDCFCRIVQIYVPMRLRIFIRANRAGKQLHASYLFPLLRRFVCQWPRFWKRRKRLWALVQTKPVALVLLVSDSRENLEAEARELHETWNHRDLRNVRHAYEIQPVALLQTARDAIVRGAGQPRRNGQQRVG